MDKPALAALPPTLPIVETDERILEDDEPRLLVFIAPLIKILANPIYIYYISDFI
jgi:hypothetical protein